MCARRFLKKNVGIALAVTATAAVLGSAPSASAGTGHSYRGSVITDVRTAAQFDYAAGEIPENITVNPDGSMTLSMLGSCAVCQRWAGHRPGRTHPGAAGPIRLVAGGLPNIDDLSFLTPWSDVVFAAQNGSSSQNGPDRIVVVYPNGTYKAVLTSADGLASPSATAVRGDQLYITDGRVSEPHDAKLQIGRINVAALLANAAH